MKYLFSLIIALSFSSFANGQITIMPADMPVSGDTLRYSIVSPVGTTINPGDSGANFNWNYTFTPTNQGVDTYQTALSVSPLYLLIGPGAYGYRVANSLPGPVGGVLPVSISQVYTFFEKKAGPPSRFQAQAFAAVISGIPTPINYTTPDVWYFFPLAYGNTDSGNFELNIALPGLGGIKQKGVRHTHVDGWGTITTPYYTTAVNCIRVRSEIHEIDSVTTPLGTIGLPRNTVEYKWLTNDDHYPALWVTANVMGGTETVNSIRYRDSYRDTSAVVIDNGVKIVSNQASSINAFPNPVANDVVTLGVPATWNNFTAEVFDMQSKQVAVFQNEKMISVKSLPAGNYLVRVISGVNVGYTTITKK